MTTRQALWLLPAAVAVHNAEEALTMPGFAPAAAERLPEAWRGAYLSIQGTPMVVAFVAATVVPLALGLWALARPASVVATRLVIAVWAILLLNVMWHAAVAALVFHGYAPGLVTAVAVNLPLGLLAIRRLWASGPPLGRKGSDHA